MKIAVSSTGGNIDCKVDMRFGRTLGFIIYNIDDDTYEFIDNVQNLNAAQGAGIQAAQNVANKDVKAVITGHCGPKAFAVLSAAGIKVYTGAESTIKEAIEKFKKGKIQEATSADVDGHWV